MGPSIRIVSSILMVFAFLSLGLGVVLLLQKDRSKMAQIYFESSAALQFEAQQSGIKSEDGRQALRTSRSYLMGAIRKDPYEPLYWARLSQNLKLDDDAPEKMHIRAMEVARFLKTRRQVHGDTMFEE